MHIRAAKIGYEPPKTRVVKFSLSGEFSIDKFNTIMELSILKGRAIREFRNVEYGAPVELTPVK